jgi:CrcB protein
MSAGQSLDAVTRLAAIGFAGAVGSMLRYLIAGFVQGDSTRFPTGTLIVNVTGCLAIGFLAERMAQSTVDPVLRSAVLIGLLGGYTTFSTFSLETLRLAEGGQVVRAGINVATSLIGCLVACWAGHRLAMWMSLK